MQAKTLYLDNATCTRPSEQAIGRMLPFLTDQWGVPSAPHRMGQRLYTAIEEGYGNLYALLGASEKATMILTSSGAEAVNQVVQGVFHDVTRATGRNQFLTSMIDEAPAIMAMGRLETLGCVAKRVEVDQHGRVTTEAVADALSPRTALLSLSWASGLTGVIHPVAEIAALCRERGVLLHLDASHVLGKLFFDLEEVGADFLSFNGEVIHGPKGTGALYIRPGLTLSPLIAGGIGQAGLRGGELNVASLVGLGVACREALDARDLLCTEIARLRQKLEDGICAGYPEAHPLFRDAERVPHITAIAFPGIVDEALLYGLSRQGLCCSMGGGLFQQIALILEASGVASAYKQSSLSFALSRATTEFEIEQSITLLCATAARWRRLSHHLVEGS